MADLTEQVAKCFPKQLPKLGSQPNAEAPAPKS